MRMDQWFLTADERGNPGTRLDSRHADGSAWSAGNDVTVLVHGGSYFAELLRSVRLMRAGDLLLFTDWRGDPDQRLDETGNGVARVFADAAARGVVVKGLLWRSHLDQFAFSEQENRHLGDEIEAAGGECLRDMRVRPGGSHHQKFVVLRHPGRPDLDVVFVGGIDLCHSRLDGPEHRGDHQRQPMAKIYGPRPPWHDVQLRIQGPAVADIETVFRERWEDPARLTNNPIHVISDLVRREDTSPGELPPATSRSGGARRTSRPGPAHVSPAPETVSVRTLWGAQRRLCVPEGHRSRPPSHLSRGSVLVGGRCRTLLRRCAARQ